MKTLKIALGIVLFFTLVSLTGMKQKNDISGLKGGEAQTELPVAID